MQFWFWNILVIIHLFQATMSHIPVPYTKLQYFVTEMCTCEHFCYKMVYCGIFVVWCIVGFAISDWHWHWKWNAHTDLYRFGYGDTNIQIDEEILPKAEINVIADDIFADWKLHHMDNYALNRNWIMLNMDLKCNDETSVVCIALLYFLRYTL